MITGRRVQMADLATLARAATSGARIAWLVGAEGVGKTTLAAAAAAASGLPVLQVDAYPEDLAEPLATVRDLAEQLGVELGAEPAPDLLRGLARHGPLCIRLEDAHWMDDASQRTLWQVARRLRETPVLLLVTSVPGPGPLLDGLGLLLRSPERGRVIQLSPFNPVEVSDYLHRRLGIPVDGESLDRIVAASGGYPVLLSSLVDQLRMGDPATTMTAALRRMASHAVGSEVLGEHVAAVLAGARPSERAALIALAQASELSFSQLAEVLRLQQLPDLRLDLLLAGGLVDRNGPRLRMRHRLVQRDLLDQVPWAEARTGHAALAEILSGLQALEHRVAAADATTAPAVLATVRGLLDEAHARGDLTHAFRVAELGVSLDPQLLAEAVLATLRAGRPARILDLEEHLHNLPASAARTAAIAILELERAGVAAAAHRLVHLDAGSIPVSPDLLIHALAVLQVTTEAAVQNESHLIPLFAPLVETLHARAAEAGGGPLAEELGLIAVSLEMLQLVNDPALSAADRLTAVADLTAWARKQGIARLAGPLVRVMTALTDYLAGNLSAARAAMAGPLPFTVPHLRLHADLALANICFMNGDWGAADSLAEAQLATTLDTLPASYWHQAFSIAALVPAGRGETSRVDTYLSWRDVPRVATLADACHQLARAWTNVSTGGSPADLARSVDKIWEARVLSHAGTYATGVLRVRGHVRAGSIAAARAAREQLATTEYEETAKAYVLAHADALLAYGSGQAAEAHALFGDALAALDTQIAQQPGGGLRIFLPVLAEDWMLLSIEHPIDPVPALHALERAETLLAHCGAGPWGARLAQLYTALSATPREMPEDGPTPMHLLLPRLTSRELEVAALIAAGLSNKDIAERLFVTVRTAEYHANNVLRKLGIRSRRQLRGLLPHLAGR